MGDNGHTRVNKEKMTGENEDDRAVNQNNNYDGTMVFSNLVNTAFLSSAHSLLPKSTRGTSFGISK